MAKIADDITQFVGNTPLVRLHRISPGEKAGQLEWETKNSFMLQQFKKPVPHTP